MEHDGKDIWGCLTALAALAILAIAGIFWLIGPLWIFIGACAALALLVVRILYLRGRNRG